ncbi:MAG TPA: hypothetical protein VFR78_19790 [Pyrinomonadaceae bacterium]|nr:hypothetical protein [Pyrinomonadaceae bacterium]
MIKRALHSLSSKRSLLMRCAIVFTLCLVGTVLVKTFIRNGFFPVRGGFDFASRMNGPGSGPALGAKVDLSMYKAPDGSSLADAITDQPAMLFVVDPGCRACTLASDQLRLIQEQVSEAGMNTFLVMFSTVETSARAFSYADSLGLASKTFVCTTDEAVKTDSVFRMVVPSHILVEKDGTVINKWPGTSPDPVARKRIVNQVVSDAVSALSSHR